MTAILIVNAVLSSATLLVIVGRPSRAITAPGAKHPGATAPGRAVSRFVRGTRSRTQRMV